MSKIINGLKENGKTIVKSFTPTLIVASAMMILFHGLKTTLDWGVLIAYVAAIGFAVYQWDAGRLKESTKHLINMAVFLVLTWLYVGVPFNPINEFILTPLPIFGFIFSLYYFSRFFIQEYKNTFTKGETN